MIIKNFVIKNRYFDSVVLMSIAGKTAKAAGAKNVAAMMGTENNKEVLRNTRMIDSTGEKAEPNDLIVCVEAENAEAIETVYKKFNEYLQHKSDASEKNVAKEPGVEITSIADAAEYFKEANIVLFSIPGPFVKREAEQALNAGKNVMIFSDNVTIEEELALKLKAQKKGLIVMGPDCGTSIINGKCLAFANAMPAGKFAIIGASGTGIQQVSVILANKGYGVKHAIGLGGRDLSEKIGGIGMLTALDAIENDADVEVIVLISKPPHPSVEKKIFERLKNYRKKVVINFLKGSADECKKRKLPFADTLESGANLAISVLQNKAYKTKDFDFSKDEITKLALSVKKKIGSGKFVKGLYSGGTLCDEALYLFGKAGIEVYSNIPLKPELKLKDIYDSYKNTLVDLGDDDFTKGRPHPMIDYTLRCGRIVQEASKKETGIILLDIVTGYGSHINPAEPLIEAIKDAKKVNKNIVFIASICGTEWDPQNITELKKSLSRAGVIFMPTNAQAVRLVSLILKDTVKN